MKNKGTSSLSNKGQALVDVFLLIAIIMALLSLVIKIFEPKKQRNSASAQRIAELERLVGRLTLELEASKKISSYFTSR